MSKRGLLRRGAGVRVKFCGITRPEDASLAVCYGVHAIGLVFYPRSPRAVDPMRAVEIVGEVPPAVTRVGLFVDPEPAWVDQVLSQVPLDLLQFHGSEPAALCGGYALPYLKALRWWPGMDLVQAAYIYAAAFGILVDSYRRGLPGGTGRVLPWRQLPALPGRRLVLAGGLRAQNVAQAIRLCAPYAVDVSSGIEVAPGHKDPGRMQAFLRAVQGVPSREGNKDAATTRQRSRPGF